MVAGVEEVNVVLPNMLKPTVVAATVEFEGTWPKAGPPETLVVAVTVAGDGFPNWNTVPEVAKLVSVLGAELVRPPNRKGCAVLVVTAVTVTLGAGPVDAGGFSPKLKTGLMVASVEELWVVAVVAAVVKMTLERPVNPARVAVEAAGGSEAGCAMGLKVKGETFAGDEAAVMLPKMGLNTEDVEHVEAWPALADTVTAVFSLFGTAPKMGLKMGVVVGTAVHAVDAAVAVVGTAVAAGTAGWLAGGVFSIPNRMLGFGKEGGLLGVWPSSVNTGEAWLLGGCTASAGAALGAGVHNTGTGLVSAEMAGRELDSNDTGGCAADGGGWDAVTASVESGKGKELIYGQGGSFRSPPFSQVPTHCCKGSHHTQPSTVTTAFSRTRGSVSPKVSPQALPASSAASRAFEQRVLSAASCRGNQEFLLQLPNMLAFHCANSPPPHLVLWIHPGCSASSSGCLGVRSWPGQELWRQA